MGKFYGLMMQFKDSECKMRQVAVDKDYAEAARLKLERDAFEKAALEVLLEVEQKFIDHFDVAKPVAKPANMIKHVKSNLTTEVEDHLTPLSPTTKAPTTEASKYTACNGQIPSG